MNLEKIIRESNEFIFDLFSLNNNETKINLVKKEHWNLYSFIYKFNKSSDGVYFPLIDERFINKDSNNIELLLLHEMFGHGLYYQNSLIGKEIVKKEKELVESKDDFNLNSKMKINLENLYYENYIQIEGFALLIEQLLSQQLNLNKIYEKRFESMNYDNKIILEKYISFYNNYGELGILGQLNFPKNYKKNQIQNFVQKLFGNNIKDIKLCMLYGSKNPDSDIDLFVISNKIGSFFNGWLDIYSLTEKKFNDEINMLSLSATNPIISGEFILGDKNEYEIIKEKVLFSEITKEMIEYNYKISEQQKKLSYNFPKDSLEHKKGLSYYESFKKNAEYLSKGIKLLTYSNIKKTSL
jgi:predicted nucleotidyltransferase